MMMMMTTKRKLTVTLFGLPRWVPQWECEFLVS
jgi:hypothetical protein